MTQGTQPFPSHVQEQLARGVPNHLVDWLTEEERAAQERLGALYERMASAFRQGGVMSLVGAIADVIHERTDQAVPQQPPASASSSVSSAPSQGTGPVVPSAPDTPAVGMPSGSPGASVVSSAPTPAWASSLEGAVKGLTAQLAQFAAPSTPTTAPVSTTDAAPST